MFAVFLCNFSREPYICQFLLSYKTSLLTHTNFLVHRYRVKSRPLWFSMS